MFEESKFSWAHIMVSWSFAGVQLGSETLLYLADAFSFLWPAV